MTAQSIETIWRKLEEQVTVQAHETLLEQSLKAGPHADLFLGFIPQTLERTLHLRVSRESALALASSSDLAGIWVRPFLFADHAMIVMVLTDEVLKKEFCHLAEDLITELESSVLEGLRISVLAELPATRFSRYSSREAA